MDYTNLLKDNSGKISRVGIVGATKGYGYTLLAQTPKGSTYGIAGHLFPPSRGMCGCFKRNWF